MKTYVRSYGRTIVQPNFFGLMVTTISYSYGATLRELRYKYSKKNEFEVIKDGFIIMSQWCSGNPLIIVMQHFFPETPYVACSTFPGNGSFDKFRFSAN